MRELAAILRLADACQYKSHRAPGNLKNLLNGQMAEGIPGWKLEQLVSEIQLVQASKNIIIYCDIPGTASTFGTAEINFKPILDHFEGSLRDELVRSQRVLQYYSNLAVRDVQLEINIASGLGDLQVQQRILEIWPYILNMSPSASEFACILATIIQAHIRLHTEYKKSEIESILQYASDLNPFNYLVGLLFQEVKQYLDSKGDIDLYLENFLEDRIKGCEEVVRHATHQLLTSQGDNSIDPTDVIIIYGYSHNVMQFLVRQGQFDRKVIVVRCSRKKQFGQNDYDYKYESDYVNKTLDEHGMKSDSREIHLAELDSELLMLAEQGVRPVFLVGTRGVYNDSEKRIALSSLVNLNVARTVRYYGGKVYVFAESGKYHPNWSSSLPWTENSYGLNQIDSLKEGEHFDLLIMPTNPDVQETLVDHPHRYQ